MTLIMPGRRSDSAGAHLCPAPIEWALGAAFAVVVVALHLRGLPGSLLADDFSHLNLIARHDREGSLLGFLLGNFVSPLGGGNFAYRPILFISYALDWRLWGANALAGHLANLALHLLNSLLVGLLACRWAAARRVTAGIVAGAVYAAYPFAGEVSFWLAGRADLLAACFSLLFLLTLTGSSPRGKFHAHALRLALFALALLSKESAMPLPLVGTLLLAARNFSDGGPGVRMESVAARFTAGVRAMGPVWVAFAIYLAWRFWLFGTPVSVYPDSRVPSGLGEYLDRLALLRALGEQQPGLPWPSAWPIGLMLLLLGLFVFWASARHGRASTAVLIAYVLAAAIYVLSPALSFPAAGMNGEGARNYYVGWIFVAAAIGLVAVESVPTLVVSMLLAGWLLVAQDGSLRQWQHAARLMRAVTSAIPALAQELGPERFAALLLPDHLNVALFARNAQGGIVMRPTQEVDYSDRMAGMTETDIGHWRDLLASGGLDALHRRHLDIEAFAGVYCLNLEMRLVQIDRGGAVPEEDWARSLLKDAQAAGCFVGGTT